METPDQHRLEFEGYLIELWLAGLSEAVDKGTLAVGPTYHLQTSQGEDVEVRSWYCLRPGEKGKDKPGLDITLGCFDTNGEMKAGIAGTVFLPKGQVAHYSPWLQVQEKGRGYSTALFKAHNDFTQRIVNMLGRRVKAPIDDLNIDTIRQKIEAFAIPITLENMADFVALVGERTRWLSLTKDAPTQYEPCKEEAGLGDISHIRFGSNLAPEVTTFSSTQDRERHAHSGIDLIRELLERYEVV